MNAISMIARCAERQYESLSPVERKDLSRGLRYVATGGSQCQPIWTVLHEGIGASMVLVGVKVDVPFDKEGLWSL